MFGRRNPDRPADIAQPPHTDDVFDLDLLNDLPDMTDIVAPAPHQQPADAQEPLQPADAPAAQETLIAPPVRAETQRLPPLPEDLPRTDLQSREPARTFAPLPPPVEPAATPASAPAAAPRTIAESVIGSDDFFDGRYRSERGVRIQGNARGSIESRQYIFVEAGADVSADLSAEDITISGDFTGKITCRRRLEITSTGKVQGQVQTALLVVQEGGALDGELQMRAGQPAAGE